MTFQEFLAANGWDVATLSDKQKANLLAAWKAEYPPAPKKEPEKEPIKSTAFDDTMAAIEAESARVVHIQEATAAAAQKWVGNPDKIKQFRELCQAAVADKKMSARDFDLAMLRMDHMLAPMVLTPPTQQVNESLIEAAICVTHKLPNVEKKFSEQVLQAAHTRFRHGLGLQELLSMAAERNGNYRGSSRDLVALCRAAFRRPAEDYYNSAYAAVGPSTITVPGILSNVANKFLEAGFLYSEQAWRGFAKIKSARDFKQMSSYRLTAGAKFKRVQPGGEVKHGSLGELTYTNQVDTYGILLGIDRRDMINDDLGAFSGLSQEMGRGAGDSLNDVFYTEWLDDSDFFNTDKSKNNYDDGATDSVLTIAGLTNADAIFAAQTKPDGTPLGAKPAILLVPRALLATARTLMNSTITNLVSSTTATTGDINPFSGMYRVVDSVYLQATTLDGATVTGSSTAWYLLADPNDIAAIEIAFLNGVENPTIETSEFDFDRLGLAMRGILDFGTNKQEYRAGLKLKGAA